MIDFNLPHPSKGALAQKNQANLPTDVVGLLPYANHATTIQNRGGGMHVSCAGQMPYIDASNVLHFPSNVIFFRPSGDYCRIDVGSSVSVGAWEAVFIDWVSQGAASVYTVGYNASDYAYIFNEANGQNYEIVGYINGDSSQLLFHAPWVNASHVSGMQNTLDVNGNMKSSSNMNGISSTPPSAGLKVTPSYTATTSSIQYSTPAYTWYRADGTSFTIPAWTSTNYTGLTAGATYYTTIYYNLLTGAVNCIAPQTTAPTPAQYIVALEDTKMSMYIGYSAALPTSGTSGGGGTSPTLPGKGCPAVEQSIETLERGMVQAGTLAVGEHLRDPFNGWNEITDIQIDISPIWRIKTADSVVLEVEECSVGNFVAINCERHRYVLPADARVNDTHRIMLANGEWVYVRDLRAGDEIMPLPGDLAGQIGHNISG